MKNEIAQPQLNDRCCCRRRPGDIDTQLERDWRNTHTIYILLYNLEKRK